ncbi:MAG: hypothetical protein ACOCRX_01015 [Candidatus Woesearchaeota archaeon]
MLEKLDFKRILIIILIAIMFTSLSFMFSSTLSNEIYDSELRECSYPKTTPGTNQTDEDRQEYEECSNHNQDIRDNKRSFEFFTRVIIFTLALVYLIIKSKYDFVDLGIFFGSIIGSTITFVSAYSASITELVVSFALFLFILFFIKRNYQELF